MLMIRIGRAPAVLLTIVLIAACAAEPELATPTPTAAIPTPSATTAARSDPPFRPVSWPAADASACDEDGYAGLLGRIEATDARTVVFTLCAPDGAFPARIAHPAFGILDSAAIELLASDLGAGVAVSGTGPYRIARWAAGEELELVRSETFVGPAPTTETLVIRWDPTPAQRLIDLQSQVVDAIDDPRAAAAVSNDPALRLIGRPNLATMYLGFTPTAPFDVPAVRAAIARGLDRLRIVELLPDGSEPATYLTPCSIGSGCRGAAWPERDPLIAKEALQAAGVDLEATYPIHVPRTPIPGVPSPVRVAEAIALQLSEDVGLRTELDVLEADAFASALAAGELPGMHVSGVAIELADPIGFVSRLTSGRGLGTPDPQLLAAVRGAADITDPVARDAVFMTVNDRAQAVVPLIPLATPGTTAAFRADVEGSHTSPLGLEALGAMRPAERRQLVWMQATEPAGGFCADASTLDAYRVCGLVTESLYGFESGTAKVAPRIAERCTADASATTWTCVLRPDGRFHDGARLDAADVVASYAASWDLAHPYHAARPDGRFSAWRSLFGGFRGVAGP